MGQSTSAEDAIAIAIASDKVNSYRFLLKLLKKFPRDERETDLKPFVVRYGAFAIPTLPQWAGDGIIDFLIFKAAEGKTQTETMNQL